MAGIDDLTLENIMSRRIVTAAPDCQLGVAAGQMAEQHVSSLVIVDGGKVAGILTERDLVRLVHERTPPETTLARVMTHPVIAAPHDLDVRSGHALLRQHRVRHLLVTAADGAPVGIATATDFRTHLGLEVFRKIDDLQSVKDTVAAELPPAATLGDAVQLMVTTGSDYVLVVEQHVLLGILTERDLSGLLAGNAAPQTLPVDQVMTAPVHCLSPSSSVADAAAAMARLRVRHMPVTDARNVVQGVVSQARLLEKIGFEWLDDDRRESLDLREDNARLQDRLSLTLEAAAVGIWEYDHPADRVIWNRGSCDLLGYREEQAPTRFKDWLDMVHPDDRPDLLARIEAAQAPDSPLYKAEYRLRRACGAWCWIHARGRLMHRSSDGRPLLTAGTMADVSARKHAEITLRAQHQLAQALASEADRPALWTALLESALMLPEIDCGVLYRIDGGNRTLLAESRLGAMIRDRDGDAAALPTIAAALARNRPVTRTLAPDQQHADGCRFAPTIMEAEALRSITALAIQIDGEATTCLCLGSRYCRELPAETVSALQTLVPPFTLAVQRIRAKEDAQHQRKNIEGLFRAMSDFLFVTDGDGRIVHYNEPVARRLAPDAGWLGVPIWQIHPPEVQDEARSVLRDIAAGRRATCSLPLVARDGQRILVDTRVVHGEWNGEPALLGLARDVTELMGQRDAASRSDTLLRTTLDSTADGLLVCGVDGEVLLMNSRFRDLWQMPDELCAARTNGPLLRHASEQLADPKAFLAGVQQLYGCDDEHTDYLEFKDGRVYERFTRPLRLGRQAARLWSFRDMTERAHARRAVEYERSRLKSLIRTIPDLVWLKDPDGIYLACNPSFEKLYGAPEAHIVGRTDYDFVDRATAEVFRAKDREAIEQGSARVNEESLTFADDSYSGIFETIKTPMYDADGTLIGVLGVSRDISEQKRTQAELEQEAIRRRILFEQSVDGIVVLDERGGVYESNPRFAQLLGYTPEETRLLHVWDWDAQWSREELLQRLLHDPADTFESRHRRKDGSVYEVEVSTNLAEWNGQRLRYCVCRDISDRKAAERALRESEERFRITFDQAADGIALIDADTLRFTQFNEAAHRQLGYTRAEFAAFDLGAIQAELEVEQIGERVATIIATGKADFDSRHRCKNGELRDVRITNRVVQLRGRTYFAALWTDITDQKRAEKALRETAMFLKESQSIAHVGGWKANPATGMLIWTEEVYRLVEHPLDEAPASLDDGLRYYAPEHLPAIRQRMLDSWQHGTPFTTECEMIAHSGRRFWAELRCVGRVEQEDGQAFITGTFQDITERRRFEDEIRRREKYLRAVIDNFPFLVWLKDTEGRFLAVNAPFAAACGQSSPDSVTGKTDLDLWPGELAERYRRDDQAVLTSGRPKSTEEPFEANGTRQWIETYKSPILLGEQVLGTVGFARDVTQRQEIESRLRDSEQALREAQAIALVGSWTLDLRRSEMRWSDETYRILEVPHGTELRQDSFLSRIHPDDLSSVRNAWDKVLSGCPFDIEHRIVVRDGIRWVRERAEVRLDERGEAFFAVGTVQDVTERRTAEEQLRKLWLAVEQSPNSIVITDTEARIEYVNQAFVDSTGYSREDALGQNPRLLDSGQTPKNTHRELWAALARGETWEGEFINRRRDGSLYTESARISPVRQPSGQITHYLAVKEDITERKQATAELERYRHHLEELVAERTAELAASRDAAEAASRAKSAFLANMSHEIRTPLNAIVGLTYLLRRRIVAPEAQRQLGKVTEAANHLLTLINDILDISKIEAGKLTLNQAEFDLTSLLERVTALFWDKAAERRLEVVYDIDPELTGIFVGDPVRLGQVLLNLVGNAVKFTESGYVLVRMQRQAEGGDTLWLRCEVRDTGIGIHPDDQNRLFAAFEQADSSTTRRYGGTGLGLAISRRLVHLMGGDIGVTSALGRGSTFWFTTRLIKIGKHPGNAREALRKRLSGQRALVVDDLPAVRAVLAGLLRDLGLTVDTTASTAQALASLATAHRSKMPYDLMIVDRQLSEPISSNDASSVVDELGKAVPRMISLGRGDLPERPTLAVAADQPWVSLAKPVTPGALYEALDRALDPADDRATGSGDTRPGTAAPAPNYTSMALLVVEDNAINREVVMALLDELGIRPDIAHHGAEAVEMASGRAYDLILMDVQMPMMDGLAATRAIRRLPHSATVPIIAMTANAFDEDRTQCLAAGMDGMLVKPVEPEALFTTITGYLASRDTVRAAPQPFPTAAWDTVHDQATARSGSMTIDPELGLRYTGGDVARYHRALRRFVETHDQDLVRLRSLLEGHQLRQAEHVVHSLKGVAALLGATGLRENAAELEAALRADASGSALNTPLAALETAHHALLEALPELLAGQCGQPGTPMANRAICRSELLRLEALLAEDDASVAQFYTSCAPALRNGFGMRADQLSRLLDNFDYPLALELVRELLAAFPNSNDDD